MNVSLVYMSSRYNFDVYLTSPLSFFYEIASKVFQLNRKQMVLLYAETKLPDDDYKSVSSFFQEELLSIVITVQVVLKMSLPHLHHPSNSVNGLSSFQLGTACRAPCLSQTTASSTGSKSPQVKLIAKQKKLSKAKVILCQLCGAKPSLFYCRECNEFICLECNTKYSEHIRHELLEVEDGNYAQCAFAYEEELMGQLKVIQEAFRKSNEWNNTDKIKRDFFNEFIAKLQEIDQNAQKIAAAKVNQRLECTDQYFFTLNDYIQGLLKGRNFEKGNALRQVFSEFNKKEREIGQLIACVSLEVIKAKYNYRMIEIFSSIHSMLNTLLVMSVQSLANCSSKEYQLEDLIQFNDDCLMKPLKSFLYQWAPYSTTESERLRTSNDIRAKTIEKPLFTQYTQNANQFIKKDSSSIAPTEINLNKRNIKDLFSSNQTTRASVMNEVITQYQNKPKAMKHNKKILLTESNASSNQNRNTKQSIDLTLQSETLSPQKSLFKGYLKETSTNQLNDKELIDSASINPLSGNPQLKKRLRKNKFDANQII